MLDQSMQPPKTLFLDIKQDKRENDQGQDCVLPDRKNLVLRMLKHPLLRPYYRLMALVIFLNAVGFVYFADRLSFFSHGFTNQELLNVVLLNFGIGIFIRQQWVINVLFKVATSVPTSWPLSLRWAAAKVYHFGGIHIGGFFAGSVWYALYFASLIKSALAAQMDGFMIVLTAIHLVILIAMMMTALPRYRFPYHDVFERTARFGSWASLALFWLQTLVYLSRQSAPGFVYVETIFAAPQVYALVYLSFCVALPWLRLKKVPVDIVTPSNHVALSSFDHGETPFAGSSTELSLSPLLEWHAFANIPTPGKDGFRLAISRAGDWTGEFIEKKPSHVWVKGITTAGVGNVELCFKKVIWLATGSGVGPCLPHLLSKKVPSRLVWATRSPRKTYGDAFVDEILEVQPDAVIWDTTEKGKPDLAKLAYEALKQFDAEAVICISNKKLTFHVNFELESRGIPCLGAIWDS